MDDNIRREKEDKYLQKMARRAIKELSLKAYGENSKQKIVNYKDLTFFIDEKLAYGDEDDTLGYYFVGKNKIAITSWLFDPCINKLNIRGKNILQQEFNEKITMTLMHEIIHHFVYVNFTLSEFNKYNISFERDSSPIFIAILLWLNPKEKNGYDSFENFNRNKLQEFNTFDELIIYCKNLMIKINNMIDSLDGKYTELVNFLNNGNYVDKIYLYDYGMVLLSSDIEVYENIEDNMCFVKNKKVI